MRSIGIAAYPTLPRPCDAPDFLCQGIRRQRPACDNPKFVRIQSANLFAADVDQWFCFQDPANLGRKNLAVHRECMPRGHASQGSDGANQQRVQPPQFLLQQPGRGVLLLGFQRVAAHQFRQLGGLVRRSLQVWAHLIKDRSMPCPSHLPSRFAACQSAANNVNFVKHIRSQ